MARISKGYGLGAPLQDIFPTPILSKRAPLSTDKNYEIGQIWIDTNTDAAYIQVAIGSWSAMSAGTSAVDTINSLAPVAGNIIIAGGTNITDSNAGHTVTLKLNDAISLATSVTSPLYTANAANLSITSAANKNIILKMGDAVGAQKVSFQDSAGVEVFSVNSDGAIPALGATTFNGLVTMNASALIKTAGADLNLATDNSGDAVNLGTGTVARAITIGSGAAHTVAVGGATTGNIAINSGAGTLLLDSSGVLELNSSADVISIGNDAVAQAINIGTGAAQRTITVGNSTGTSGFVLKAGSGGIKIGDSADVVLVSVVDIAPTASRTTTLNGGTVVTASVTDTLDLLPDGATTNADSVKTANLNCGNVTLGQILTNIGTGTITSGTHTVGIQTGNAAAGTVTTNISTGTGTKTVNLGNVDANTTFNIDAATSIADNVNANTKINTGTSTGTVDIGSANAGAVTFASGATVDIDGVGAVSINSSGDVINVGNDAIAQNINVGTGGARVVTIGNNSGATSVKIDVGTGGADFAITATDHTTTMGSTTGVSATTLQSGTGYMTFTAGGHFDVNATSTVTIDSSGGNIAIGSDADAGSLQLGTGGARPIFIGNTNATQISISTGTAGVANLFTNANQQTITIGNTTALTALLLKSGTGNSAFSSSGDTTIDTAGVLELNSSAGVISIGNDAVSQDMNFGTAGTRTVTVGSTTTTSGLVLQAGTGEITVTGTVKDIEAKYVAQSGIYIPSFTQDSIAATAANTGGVPTGTTGDVNIISLQDGFKAQAYVVGAGQTILQPVMGANGLIISGDLANTEGYEYNFPYYQFTIGTSAAFQFVLKYYITTMAGSAPYIFGFRKTEANNATWTSYDTYATMGMIATSSATHVVLATELNGAGTTITDTTDNWGGDATAQELAVLVDGSGNVTYTINGSAPTATAAFQFDNGDVVIPFIRIEHNASAAVVAAQKMKIGYQL
jgi:hypothetical protein